MPFTISHAVVALPFLRTPLVPAAVAIGAMIPDLPMFIRPIGRVGISYARTHDYAWLPLTIAVAFLAFLLWRCVLRAATVELAPGWIAERLPETWAVRPRTAWREIFGPGRSVLVAALVLALSFAIGVASHILWDSFTHEGRGGVDAITALDAAWGPLPGYKWLQYGSGVVGVTVLVICGVLWWRRQPVHGLRRRVPTMLRVLWWLSLPVVMIIAGAAVAIQGPPSGESLAAGHIVYGMLPALGAWGLCSIALSVVIAVRSRPEE